MGPARAIPFAFAILQTFTLTLSGCAFQKDKSDAGGVPGIAASGIPTISYAQVNDAVFKPACISCHGNDGRVNLETYAAVKANLSKIESVTVLSRQMPPSGDLSDDARTLLAQWIAQGAPETVTTLSPWSGGAPIPNASPSVRRPRISFAYITDRVLGPKCVSCHGDAGGLGLEDYSEVKANLAKIKQRALIEKSMPPDGALTDQEREVLADWIQSGAPETEQEEPPPPAVHHEAPLPPVLIPNPQPAPPAVTLGPIAYSTIRDRILTPRCVSCHGHSGDVNLESYPQAMKALARIALSALITKSMPPTSPLSSEDTLLLTEWIKAGAPETPGLGGGATPLPVPTVTVTVTPACPGGSATIPTPMPQPSVRPS